MKTLITLCVALFALVACSKTAEPPKDEAPKVEKKVDEKKAPEKAKADEPAKKKEADPAKVAKADPKLVEDCKANVKLDLKASKCDTCITIGAWIITKVGCGAGEVALDVACTAAEVVFFEFDEIIAPLCTAMEITLPIVCKELGPIIVKNDPKKAAKIICQKAGLCS